MSQVGNRAGWTLEMLAAWRELETWHKAQCRPELVCGALLPAGGQCGGRPAAMLDVTESADGPLCWGHFVDETWQGPSYCRDCGDGLTADELERPDRRCADCGRLAPAEE